MDVGLVVVVVVVLLMLGVALAFAFRGSLSALVRFPGGGSAEVRARRDPVAPPAAPEALVRDAESTEGGITARSTGDATVERGKAKGDISAIAGGETDPKA
jgi:hypothetical protein